MGIKRFVPRFLVSKMVYFVAKAKKIKPPQKMEFKIADDNLQQAEVLMAICHK